MAVSRSKLKSTILGSVVSGVRGITGKTILPSIYWLLFMSLTPLLLIARNVLLKYVAKLDWNLILFKSLSLRVTTIMTESFSCPVLVIRVYLEPDKIFISSSKFIA